VSFVRKLQAKTLENKTVSLALGAATTRQEYMDKGFNIRALGMAVDRLALMAYDLHGPTWSGPGPIGPIGWTRTVLKPLLEEVELAKIDLGVAGYGYTWPKNRTGKTVTVAGARRLVEQDGRRRGSCRSSVSGVPC
jgi:spore germination protein YaaH